MHTRWVPLVLMVLAASLGAPPATAQPPGPSPVLPGGDDGSAPQGVPRTLNLAESSAIVEKESETLVGLPPPPARRFRLEASWDSGLRFESDDNQFHLHVGGNAQVDSTWLIGPHGVFALPGGGNNGVENAAATFLRRARLRLEGDIFDQFDYIIEYDFAHAENENSGLQPNSFQNIAGSATPCNVWMQIREVPFLGNVRFGNQVKPIGMTNNTYQGFLPFLERADNQDAFYGPFDSGFDLGLTARNWAESERMTWQFGIYRPSIDTFATSLNKHSVGGRVTALPWYEDEGRRLLHLGLGCQGGEVVQNQLRVRARTVMRNAPGYAVPILVDTGEIPGSRQVVIARNWRWSWGPGPCRPSGPASS